MTTHTNTINHCNSNATEFASETVSVDFGVTHKKFTDIRRMCM